MAISEAMTATPRVKSIQRTALAMLVVAGVINYVDRATLAVANLTIRDDLHLSIADMGYLLSAFLWAYAFAQLPTGADELGEQGARPKDARAAEDFYLRTFAEPASSATTSSSTR